MPKVSIRIPKLGMDTTEAVISKWLVQEGASIEVGTLLVDLESEKVNFEYPSEVAGRVLQILVGEGETVPVGEIVAIVESD